MNSSWNHKTRSLLLLLLNISCLLLQERVKLAMFARDKMRQHCEQQEAQRTPRLRQSLRRVTAEVASDEAASLKGESLNRWLLLVMIVLTSINSGITISLLFPELQLNGSVLSSTKPEALTRESPASPTSAQGPQNPRKCFSPHHQPCPPTGLPTRHTLPRLRRAPSLTRAQASLSNSSGNASSYLKDFSLFFFFNQIWYKYKF